MEVPVLVEWKRLLQPTPGLSRRTQSLLFNQNFRDVTASTNHNRMGILDKLLIGLVSQKSGRDKNTKLPVPQPRDQTRQHPHSEAGGRTMTFGLESEIYGDTI